MPAAAKKCQHRFLPESWQAHSNMHANTATQGRRRKRRVPEISLSHSITEAVEAVVPVVVARDP